MYIYIIHNGSAYKIGISKDPARRLKQLQTAAATKLSIYTTYAVPSKIAKKLETQLHRMFWQSRARYNGEWFVFTEAHLETIHQWLQPYLVNQASW